LPVDRGQFTFTRTGSTSAPLTVNYTVAGTATNGSDYNRLSGSVTFVAGASSATIVVNPIDDTLLEGQESVVVTLATGSTYELGSPSSATVAIADNDKPSVTMSVSDDSAAEPVSGLPVDSGQFTFTRTGSTSAPLTVNYTVAGTATNGSDYNSLSGSLTFVAGASTATIDVNPIDDALYEGTETVIVSLAEGSAYTIGSPSSGTVAIADNEQPPVTISATDPNGSEEALNPGLFTLYRSINLSVPLTVYYAVSGTAKNGVDYDSLSGSVTFAAGASTATIEVKPIDDTLYEGTETVVVSLLSGPDFDYSLGVPSSANLVIADNDTATITVTSPNGGESWLLGSSHAITWTDNIEDDKNVIKIELDKGGTLTTLFASTLSDGSENWTIPTTLAAGTDYKIKISLLGSTVSDLSDLSFTLTLV
jgi:hypothetical protein